MSGPSASNQYDLTNKVAIVTGSSDGIGFPTAVDLLEHGAKVIFACRNEAKTNKIINNLDLSIKSRAKFIQLDLSSFKKHQKLRY